MSIYLCPYTNHGSSKQGKEIIILNISFATVGIKPITVMLTLKRYAIMASRIFVAAPLPPGMLYIGKYNKLNIMITFQAHPISLVIHNINQPAVCRPCVHKPVDSCCRLTRPRSWGIGN